MKRRQGRISDKDRNQRQWLASTKLNSWHLELIFSSIALFVISKGIGYIQTIQSKFIFTDSTSEEFIYLIFKIILFELPLSSLQLLLIVFLISLSLRGMWIAALGLRPEDGAFRLNELRYQAPLSRWLTKRLRRYDKYLDHLDHQARITFASGILLFFVNFGLGVFTSIYILILYSSFALLIYFFDLGFLNPLSAYIIGVSLLILALGLLLLSILYAIDFLAFGALKRVFFLRKIYFPAYRLLGWLTVARIYRPLYYAIIHLPRQRRTFRWFLVGFILFSFLNEDFEIHHYPYIPNSQNQGERIASRYYADEVDYTGLTKNNFEEYLKPPSISSKYPHHQYVEVFIPYRTSSEDDWQLYNAFDSLSKAYFFPVKFFGLFVNDEADPTAMLAAHSSLYRLYLNDSLLSDIHWRFYKHPERRQEGLLYHLPIHNMPIGEHTIGIDIKAITRTDSVYWWHEASIPFFK